mmetsp:Transcript_29429/g.88138  ORF Transcript_29429/g.88138 Transcript_29429/m.88138 type:complete len:242 (+) Transcript_29429:552-1277(+)
MGSQQWGLQHWAGKTRGFHQLPRHNCSNHPHRSPYSRAHRKQRPDHHGSAGRCPRAQLPRCDVTDRRTFLVDHRADGVGAVVADIGRCEGRRQQRRGGRPGDEHDNGAGQCIGACRRTPDSGGNGGGGWWRHNNDPATGDGNRGERACSELCRRGEGDDGDVLEQRPVRRCLVRGHAQGCAPKPIDGGRQNFLRGPEWARACTKCFSAQSRRALRANLLPSPKILPTQGSSTWHWAVVQPV